MSLVTSIPWKASRMPNSSCSLTAVLLQVASYVFHFDTLTHKNPNKYQISFFDRTKRVWKPNVVRKTYYSQVLEQYMRFQFSTHALRCIDKAGGFDNYIINTKEKWLHSRTAIELKHLMLEVVRCKEHGMAMSEIRKEVFPKPKVSRHVHIPKTFTTRFYFDWKGPRKQVVYC